MGLTLEAEQRMENAGVIAFYDQHQGEWLATVRDTKRFVEGNFPDGARIRRDDVAKALVTVVEVNEGFQDFRNERKLRGKFWNTLFADLVVDRTWEELEEGDKNGEDGPKPEGS